MKTLLKTEYRFLVKKIDKNWRVYDKARGSFPYKSPEFGEILQDVSEAEAIAEADRLNTLVDNSNSLNNNKKNKPKKEKAPELEQEDLPELPELPDYGVMSEEDRKKYEDGLLEKVTY